MMESIEMQTGEQRLSPQSKARLAGVFYALTIVAGSAMFFVQGTPALAIDLIASASYIVVALIFYGLFRPVNRVVSAVAAFVGIAGCTVGKLLALYEGVNTLVFFGAYCILIGFLIMRSKFMPRILGLLMSVAGLCWLTFLSPSLGRSLSPYNMAVGGVCETLLTVWLLTAGVNVERWNAQAASVD